jgi:uncharacterized protein
MMKTSKYNIISKIKDSPNYFIMNVLSGSADILTAAEHSLFTSGKDGIIDENLPEYREFVEKGYVADEEQEEKLYREAYFTFLEERDEEEVQLFFVPTYACNFNCFYCYQDAYTSESSPLTREIIQAFYSYVDRKFGGKKKYITLFGGEPFLGSQQYKEMIGYFIEEATKRGIGISAVTNGYRVQEFLPLFKDALVREIQITLDGTGEIHNKRRPLKGGGKTFDTIIEGIDACLAADIPVNLRVVIDKENISNLVELSRFAIEKGWTQHPRFKTQLGRNYELHTCQQNAGILFSRLEMHKELYLLIRHYPEILEFHKPSFSIAKYLAENSLLPEPIFDDCPGAKYEWAFDYKGNIYACTATVGKSGEELGTFYPEVKEYEDKISCWEDRDITTIPGCRECAVQLICGGGCASLAKNKNGDHMSGDCRPVTELLELGMGLYYRDV